MFYQASILSGYLSGCKDIHPLDKKSSFLQASQRVPSLQNKKDSCGAVMEIYLKWLVLKEQKPPTKYGSTL